LQLTQTDSKVVQTDENNDDDHDHGNNNNSITDNNNKSTLTLFPERGGGLFPFFLFPFE